MKTLHVLAVLLLAPVAALAASGPIEPQFDSSTQVLLDAEIPNGVAFTASTTQSAVSNELRRQLDHSEGQLNAIGGVPKISQFRVEILSIQPLGDGSGLNLVSYVMKGHVSWNKSMTVPVSYELLLPAQVHEAGLGQFHTTYRENCTESPSEATPGAFFYYYRPLQGGCPLNQAGQTDVVRLKMKLSVSAKNSQGKFPEYGKIWEDGVLTATMIMGKYEPGATSDSDYGISSFNRTYSYLISTYGTPDEMNERFEGAPGVRHPILEMKWNNGAQKRDIHLYLTDSLKTSDSEFRARVGGRTLVSDMVLYSGHAGLGANVRALENMSRFSPGKYQLYVINGCDTYAYTGSAIFDGHAQANPGVQATKYVDIIGNSMPSSSTQSPSTIASILSALHGKNKTYRQILSEIDPYQRAVVDGEEDNNWPGQF